MAAKFTFFVILRNVSEIFNFVFYKIFLEFREIQNYFVDILQNSKLFCQQMPARAQQMPARAKGHKRGLHTQGGCGRRGFRPY